jgi:hypothetical protein
VTVEGLRELFEERVADVEPSVPATAAWARADGVRRRRRIAAIGTAAAAALALAGGVAILEDQVPRTSSPSGRPDSTPSPSPTQGTPRAELAGRFHGAPFWWAPSATADPYLPALQVPYLPDVLSMADEKPVATPPARVDAVFGTGKQRYRLLADGKVVSVDLTGLLGPVADEGGNEFNPLLPQSVSPDGTRVAFAQPGRVAVWELPTNTWQSVPTPDDEQVGWTRDGVLWLPGDRDSARPDPWPYQHQYSPVVVGPAGAAELDWLGRTEVPGAEGPGRYANPEILVAGRADDPSVLAVGVEGRSKICCSLAGWFSHDFVLFGASSGTGYRILAWRVGTPDLYRVSQYTDVPRQFAVASWAEDAFTGFAQ